MSFPPLFLQLSRWILSLSSQTPFLAPATCPTRSVEVPVAVDASVKTKSVDQKEKKNPHKSRKDKHSDKSVKTDPKVASSDSKSDKKGTRRSEKNATGLSHRSQNHLRNRNILLQPRLIPAPESAHQSVLFKGDNSQPSSGPDKSATSSLFRSTSTVSQPEQDQAGTGACAYPPAREADPYEQISEDDMERSVAFSGSDDGQFSDSTETPLLKLIILSKTNPIIPGRAKTKGNLQGYLWPCPRMTGYARNWSD